MPLSEPPPTAPDSPAQPRWSSRSVGTPLQHGIFYLLIRLGGTRAAVPLLHAVALYYVLLRPSIRRRTLPYLTRRFPAAPTWRRLLLAYRMIVEFGKVLIDRAAMGMSGLDPHSITLSGRETLLGVLGEGHGVVLLTAHVGCWQTGMAALNFIDVPVHLLMQREEGDIDLHYFEHRGLPCPFRIIDPRGFLGGSIEMLQALKRGEVVSVMGDRDSGSVRNTVAVEFLGGTARFPFSPFKIAAAAGAPVVVLLSHRTGLSSAHLEVVDVIRVPDNLRVDPEEFKPFVEKFVKTLEDYVTAHPFQFFNFYDMWDINAAQEPVRNTAPSLRSMRL